MTTPSFCGNLVADFQRDGFVLVPRLFDAYETAALRHYARGDGALSAEAYVRRDTE